MDEQLPRDLLKDWPVLVVDDDPDSLDIAARILRHYGATVTTATNGQEGLEAVRAERPRFIISDLNMPVMNGWEMLHELQLNRTTAGIPAIALTAHGMVGDRDRAIAAGFLNFLTKPLTPRTFMKDLLVLILDIPELAAHIALR
jgi:CheY-like chemotaxis protein